MIPVRDGAPGIIQKHMVKRVDLARKLGKLWKMKVTLIPVIDEALGIIQKQYSSSYSYAVSI